MPAYSFKNVSCSFSGPGAVFSIGDGMAEEGITIEPIEDKDVATWGADGSVMHSLVANNGATITIRLLKTSPTNAMLQNTLNFQKSSSVFWGKNVIVVSDPMRGDLETLTELAFSNQAANTYAKEGNVREWKFLGKWSSKAGIGTPEV